MVITAVTRAGPIAESVTSLAAFNAEAASGEGAQGLGESRPATCCQGRMKPAGKTIGGQRGTCRMAAGRDGAPVPS